MPNFWSLAGVNFGVLCFFFFLLSAFASRLDLDGFKVDLASDVMVAPKVNFCILANVKKFTFFYRLMQ
jgi:hypothetical protein